jgi:succinate-acetate transporter protein
MADSKIADPLPLGLAAFGITLIMLSSLNAGLWHGAGGGALIGTSIFLGGITLFFVGLLEFFRGNTFTATVFTAFGAFWSSAWYWLTNPAVQAKGSLGVFIGCFAIASIVMWVVAMRLGIHFNLLFFLLMVTLFAEAYGNWGGGHSGAVKLGGWTGIVTSVIAIYIAAKMLINEAYGKAVLP